MQPELGEKQYFMFLGLVKPGSNSDITRALEKSQQQKGESHLVSQATATIEI